MIGFHYIFFFKKKPFQKNHMKAGVKKLLRAGMMPAKVLGSPCSGDGSHGEVKIEETDGSSSRQKEYDLIVLVHRRHTAWKWKKSFPPWPLSIGQKEFGLEHGGTNKKKRGSGKFKKFRREKR